MLRHQTEKENHNHLASSLQSVLKDDYNPHHGGKWSVDDLLFYIASLRGSEAADLLWQEICWVIGNITRYLIAFMSYSFHI